MKTPTTSKAGLALVAAAAISLCVPAYAAPGPDRHGRSHASHARSHAGPARGYAHHHAPQRHRGHSGAGLGLLLGAVVVGAAIIASESHARAPVVVAPAVTYAPPAPPPGNFIEPVPTAVQGYWYYCRPANGYYPYAQRCPTPWELVVPQPPAPGSTPPG